MKTDADRREYREKEDERDSSPLRYRELTSKKEQDFDDRNLLSSPTKACFPELPSPLSYMTACIRDLNKTIKPINSLTDKDWGNDIKNDTNSVTSVEVGIKIPF